jgi:hypothetical protein
LTDDGFKFLRLHVEVSLEKVKDEKIKNKISKDKMARDECGQPG